MFRKFIYQLCLFFAFLTIIGCETGGEFFDFCLVLVEWSVFLLFSTFWALLWLFRCDANSQAMLLFKFKFNLYLKTLASDRFLLFCSFAVFALFSLRHLFVLCQPLNFLYYSLTKHATFSSFVITLLRTPVLEFL